MICSNFGIESETAKMKTLIKYLNKLDRPGTGNKTHILKYR